MLIAIILLVLVLGTVAFHFLSPWYFTPIASNWSSMDDTITLTFVVTGLGFVLVNVFIAYCLIKFRHKPDRRAEYEPESIKMETWLTIWYHGGYFGHVSAGPSGLGGCGDTTG